MNTQENNDYNYKQKRVINVQGISNAANQLTQ